ncbi:NAD(P)/FAD-dependent oxidoreductase [Sphaerisporangium viridialbum]|uniref:NAD(P)/FAD-dependent oxidoreductase n=1 Tax=Sphaerisporangium viridialbum TaxID=46189 RepID=UPI003C71280E
MRATCDVTIAGGGIVGCAIAHRLSAEGRRVVVVDGGTRLGTGASSAAMGGIITETDEMCLGPLRELVKRSRDLYPAWLETIIGLSGIQVPLLSTGALQIALDDEEMTRLQEEVLPRWRAIEAKVEPLSRHEVLRVEPLISEEVRGGFHLPTELALEPTRLMSSLSAALWQDPSIRIEPGSWVERVEVHAGGVAVTLDNGGRIESGHLVVAGGHLSGSLVPGHASLLLPIKGEAMEVLAPGSRGYPLRHHVYACVEGRDIYVVPRADGRLAVGVTYERGRSDTVPTAENLAVMRRGLAVLAPEAATWKHVRHWAGVRPGTLDGIPLIGHVEPHGRVVLATGHVGLGITLAPVTAELVGALLDRGRTAGAATRALLGLCDPARFSPAVAPAPTDG